MTTVLTLALAGAVAGLAIVLNHGYARLALVELALNEGLPPGHVLRREAQPAGGPTAAATLVEPGLHIFLSRNCHACQRLVTELEHSALDVDATVVLHYIDRPRPIAERAARQQQAELRTNEAQLASTIEADPLPFTIAIGDHGLLGRGVTPTPRSVVDVARDAGLRRRR